MEENRGRGRGFASRGRGPNRGNYGNGHLLGAIPKVRGPVSNGFRGSNRDQSGYQQRRVQNNFPQRQANQHKRLDFQYLVKLTRDTIEPSEVIRCLGDPENDLPSHLKENAGNIEYLELIVVALGGFCKKSGTSQFTGSFVTVVKMLADQKVFAQIPSMIINIPISRATNLPTKQLRLSRLTSAVFHIVTETLVLMPAFGCNILGRNFFMDILSLKLMPSIQNLNVADAFDVLQEGIPLLETAWKQHIPDTVKEDEHRLRVERYTEELSLQDPPNDFRTLNVMPNFDDVCIDVEPFLRPNIVKGVYQNVGTYLDIQFRLLREDFFNPLRLGLLAHKNQMDRKSSRGLDNIRLYQQVKIFGYDMNQDIYTIEFSNASFRKMNWENSKRFLYGSLLLLSSDRFSSFHLFTVADRNPRLLAEGKIKVKFEGDVLPAHVKKQVFVMAESTVFFESYRSVLSALQKISPANFPLKDYILGQKCAPELPEYLKNKTEPIYDFTRITKDLSQSEIDVSDFERQYSNLFKRRSLGSPPPNNRADTQSEVAEVSPIQQVHILDSATRPNGTDLGLDPSQTTALYAALTQKISVIQGPPGTGKTYLGLRIVEILLKNKKFWNSNFRAAPILVICYTNHALDQFLEGISQFTQKIVRIGSQSKCAALDSFSLHAWKKRPERYTQHDTRRWIFEIHEKLREFDKEREIINGVLWVMNSSGLINENSLLRMKVIPQTVCNKIAGLSKSIGQHGDWTSLGFWLGIYWIEGMQQVVDYFNRNGYKKQQINREFQPTGKREVKVEMRNFHPPGNAIETETPNNEEWDEELINEIQAARKVEEEEEDEDFLAQLRAAKPFRHEIVDSLSERVFVNFAYKCSSDKTEITNLTKHLETLENEDAAWVKELIRVLETKMMLVRQLLQMAPRLDDKQLENLYKQDFMQIPVHQRWMMYNTWKFKALEVQEQRAAEIEEKYHQNSQRLKDVRTLESAEICQNASIVGFTTTGAAKQRALLNHLKPKIVIVEEAAEVLEAHVVCALSSACEQLILIGDHQQLRPPVTVYRLAKEFLLDVSLFERLIKNGMEPCVLGVQHRMRPEIARLIVPSIYPQLENHSSVMDYPNVRGMLNNVFFLAHTELEKADHEGKSHLNPYEAELSLALARHLILQGYEPEKITILTTYSGQLLHFFKLRRNLPAVQSVRISVVDNFQGEENDIIILSLVRSNDDENIGFLRIENRICVALSRAKQGFYMIGNMQNLQGKSKLWDGISKILDSASQLGPDLSLKCDIHDIVTKIRKAVDFPPEGGCMEKCATEMSCGHTCPKLCHSTDRDHKEFMCQENCNRTCSSGHPCPKKCFQNCKCVVEVTKKLPCSHEQIVLCHKDPSEESCRTIIWKILPTCGHGMDLECGADTNKAKCLSLCGKKLDCGHTCPVQCHKGISHRAYHCKEPCQKTCVEQHLCQKICHEDCGECPVMMFKMIPCGHEQEVECHQHLDDVFCKVKVAKVLPNCDHLVEIECGQSTEGRKCEKPCEKILCADGHVCKKLCHELCGNCFVRMDREFNCGHTNTLECFVDPSSIKCPVPKESKLPCGHVAQIKCGEDPADAHCPFPCDIRLECGHTCTLKCHVQTDPDHETYKCMKLCGRMKRGCKREHKCGKKCFETCDLCPFKWNRTLPCGHKFFTECHYDDDEISCRKLLTKTIPECGHTIELMCSTKPTRDLCRKDCETILACGHKCMKRCGSSCNKADCVIPVTTTRVNLCGHNVTITCGNLQLNNGVPTEKEVKSHLQNCQEPCGAVLDCTHPCEGTCGECFNGRVHRACEQECGRSLVCGHICNVNCGRTCPPCKQKCEYRCVHSKCKHMCCEPCSPCQEMCQWKCEHQSCTKKCGQKCDRTRCDEVCNKMLQCGHPCVGLCGEVCPPLCRVCDKEILTEIFLGNEGDEDAKFIFLPDCGHCIEVEGMDNWMATDGGGQIQPKCCPRCKTQIRICMRYGDVIKTTFEDITKAKRKMFNMRGNPIEFFAKTRAQLQACANLFAKFENLNLHQRSPVKLVRHHCNLISQYLQTKKQKEKQVNPSLDLDTRILIQVNLDFIEQVLQMMKKIHFPEEVLGQTQMSTGLADDLVDLILKLSKLVLMRGRISTEEYRAAAKEMDRLEYLRAYYVLQSFPTFPAKGEPAQETQLIKQLLTGNTRVLDGIQKVQLRAALETLGKKFKTGLGISDQERKQIVQAFRLSQGHWYKCPNGHIYVIDACGGATHESRCNECNAAIGGMDHRLRGDNRLASEMDGATRPAWPQ